jgi:transcriptional regulator with XRE-family HTH domain
MNESFGARLRRRREEQDIALDTIAEETKIKRSLLEGLERDDVSHWPSGIFRRAFVRAYANAIGLNPDVVVSEFLEVYPDPADRVAVEPEIAPAADDGRVHPGPPTRLRYIVGSTLGSLSRYRRGSQPEHPPAVARPPADATVQAASDLPAAAPPPVEPRQVEEPCEALAQRASVSEAEPEPDFLAVAHLCTEFGRVENTTEMRPLLPEAARILHATGLIVWIWDGLSAALRPALAHGYSNAVLAQLPAVERDANNATAAAFRSAQLCVVHGTDRSSGALAVPLLTPAGCAGVLAIELRRGRQETTSVRAVATIFAAVLAQLIGDVSAEVRSRPAV